MSDDVYARVVEVHRTAAKGRGSGYAVAADLVLTVAHVTKGDTEVRVVVAGGEQLPGLVVWRDPTLDAALVRVPTRHWDGIETRWAAVSGVLPVACTAIGFPRVQLVNNGIQVEEQLAGFIMPQSGRSIGRYWINVDGALPFERPGDDSSPWAGLSGTAVLTGDGRCVLGVVVDKPFGFDAARLEAVPVATLLDDPNFAALVGADPTELWRASGGPGEATAAVSADGPASALARLRDAWPTLDLERAGGGGRDLIDFDGHLHAALRDAVMAWLHQPGSRGPLLRALSAVAGTGDPDRAAVVQAKLTGRRNSVHIALNGLWSVAQSAVNVLADSAADVRFALHCRPWALSTVSAAVDGWRPAEEDDPGAVAAFKARLRLVDEPSPRAELGELLIHSEALQLRDPRAWIERWTQRLDAALTVSGDLAGFADDLLSDLADLRLRPPESRFSPGVVVLTRKFAAPNEVTHGRYLAGDQPRPTHVENGYFCDRSWQVDPAAENLQLWLDSIESTEADISRKLPVFWFEGRSGCGKSVLMLQTLARIRQTNRGIMLWLGDNVEELPETIAFTLANTEPGDPAIIVIDDGYSPAVQARSSEHWRGAIRALSAARDAGRPLPVIVTCGPYEQRRAFQSAFVDDVAVKARNVVEQLDYDHAAELERWFIARTDETPPAHLASSNILMVQKFFQYRTGASLKSFALRFKARLEGMEESSNVPAFIAKLLAVNRLYVGLPAASKRALTAAERDVLEQLEREHHVVVSTDAGRSGVWLAHPHLADAVFREWFGEDDAHKAAGVLRDAIIECGTLGESAAERTAPLTALKLAVGRAHTTAFQSRLDLTLLPGTIAAAYETVARSMTGIAVEDLPAWIRLEQALPDAVLTPAPKDLGAVAIADPSAAVATWLPTAHALLDTSRPGDPGSERLLAALRHRIDSGDEASDSAGAIAARVAAFTGDRVDIDGLIQWLDDPRHWTDSSWAIAYRSLGSLTQSDGAGHTALAWLQSAATAANAGWGYVLDQKLSWVGDRARQRVLEAAVEWLVRPDATTNPAWAHVAQTLLREARGVQLARTEQATLDWLADERSRRTTIWHHIYRRMLDGLPPSSRRERARLIALGRAWLQSPDSFSPGWPIVFDGLYSNLGPGEREELLRAATDWVLDKTRFSDNNWINVCSSLMQHLGQEDHASLLTLATTWVREPMNQFLSPWSRFLERLIKLVDLTERDDLIVVGTQWLREWIDQDDPRWGSVAHILLRATDGRDQTELLDLARRWMDTEAAREDPLWPSVLTSIVERTPGAHQTDLLATAGRWLASSAGQPGPGWTRVLALLVDTDSDREALGALATNRLIAQRRFHDVEDWGHLYSLALGSDLVLDRPQLVTAGLDFLRTRSLDDRVDRSQVVGALLSAQDERENSELIRLELLWLWNQTNWRLPSWNRVFQVLVQAAPGQRGELRQIGVQWLKNSPGSGGWGWVLEVIQPLTSGQEREQLAAFLWTWFADPLNRDRPGFSKALECAVAMTDTTALDVHDVYTLGLDWLASGRNFVGRRWSFVFNALGEAHSPQHAPQLVDAALTWLHDVRSRADAGWQYVLSGAAPLADQRQLAELHQLAERWLADPVNWGDAGWGHIAGWASETLSGLSDRGLAAAGQWLALPLSRKSRTWRQCWKPVAPLLDEQVRAEAISTCLNDRWLGFSLLWGFRYLDAEGYAQLSAPALGEQVVAWCSLPRNAKAPVWPHVLALGLKAADPAAHPALAGIAETWLIESANVGGRSAIEAALLDPVEFGDLAVSQIRPAIVSNVVDYGAFVNLGGPRGLIHRSEMSNGRADARNALRRGQRLNVRVMKIDSDAQKVSLSLLPEQVQEPLPQLNLSTCSPGMDLDGLVSSIADFGVFVDCGGVTGLAHKSQIPGSADLHASFRKGQRVRCRVVSVDLDKQRLSLSLKPKSSDASKIESQRNALPRLSLAACNEGDLLDGIVTRVVPYGVFVDIGGVNGLLHKTEMEKTGPRSRATVSRPGYRLRVRILSIDRVGGRINLSLLRPPPAGDGGPPT